MTFVRFTFLLTALLAASLSPACDSRTASTQPPAPGAAAAEKPQAEAPAAPLLEKWTGDLDGMIARRRIRVLTTYSKTHYFIDKGQQRGITYEAFKEFEDVLNKKLKTGNLRVHVIFVPVSRDELGPALLDGRGDIAFASIVVTPDRQKTVDFSTATNTDVSEIVVTGPKSPRLATLDDLAGQEVHVRPGSIYEEHLVRLNADFKKRGKPAIFLKHLPANLEDEDLLEMLNAGLVKTLVVYSHLATFWQQVFPNIRPREDLVIERNLEIAPAIRKNSPQLKAALDEFARTNGKGTAFRNILFQRYLKSTAVVKSATNDADMKRFNTVVELFRNYGTKYSVDWLLVAAQGYQESRLDNSVKSRVGAVGVMQVMPATGRELNVGDITKLEPNIHAGVKYIRFMIDQYYANEPMDDLNKGLFAFASYNAGPARVRQLRQEAQERGLNPNVWFNNVEQIASERIGRETVTYVSNIYKYYVAYKLALEEIQERQTRGK